MKGKPTSMSDKLVWIAIGSGALFWVLEAVFHVFIFHEGTVIQQIFAPRPHEIWMRLIVVAAFIAFAIYAQLIITQRKRAEEATKHAYAELNQIFNTAADGMCVVDKDFNVLRVNNTFSTLTGVSKEETVGKKCYELFRGPMCNTQKCPLIQILGGKEIVECDVEKQRNDGVTVPCIVTATPFRASDGQLLGIVEDFKDISKRKWAEEALQEAHHMLEQRVEERTAELARATEKLKLELTERKRVEEALRESEEKYRVLFNSTNDALFVYCPTSEGVPGKFIEVNEVACQRYGYTKEELFNLSVLDLSSPEDFKNIAARQKKLLAEKHIIFEKVQVSKKGSRIPVEISSHLFMLNDRPSVLSAVRDISERKRTEEHIRTLTQEMMKAQENERQRISRDLHDRVAQDLSTLKIGLDTLFDNQPDGPNEMRQIVSDLSKMLQGTINAVRGLAYDLRPDGLDQMGLVRSVHDHCEEFSSKNQVKVDFIASGIDELKLDFDTKITLYRLIQESLNNVMKHAEASHVTIRLVASFPSIILRIEDNGKGFDVEDRLGSAAIEKRMGLRTMEERVALLQGKMRIESRLTEGTKIFIEVPYRSG